jgi:hypothetical protein
LVEVAIDLDISSDETEDLYLGYLRLVHLHHLGHPVTLALVLSKGKQGHMLPDCEDMITFSYDEIAVSLHTSKRIK